LRLPLSTFRRIFAFTVHPVSGSTIPEGVIGEA
jgi:hypothetical protein